jgi:hypothetical protein
MYRRRIPHPILTQILPKHRIPRHRPKRHPILPRLITIHKLTPPLIILPLQNRKIRSPARQVPRSNINEERCEAVASYLGSRAVSGGKPVGV